jgi:hypothetical protein
MDGQKREMKKAIFRPWPDSRVNGRCSKQPHYMSSRRFIQMHANVFRSSRENSGNSVFFEC